MWTAPRSAAIRLVTIHTNEGPDGPASAEGLAAYLRNPSVTGGYHKVVDCDSFVVLQPDNVAVAGAPYVNMDGLHICITGWSYQTDWSTPGEQAAIDRMAQLVAQWCMTYGLPVRRLSIDQMRDRVSKGICGHVDVTNAFKYMDSALDHTDPGPNFPWDQFLGLVQHYVNPQPPAPKPKPPEWIPMFVSAPFNAPITDNIGGVSDMQDGTVRVFNIRIAKLDGTVVALAENVFGTGIDVMPRDTVHWPTDQWDYCGMEAVGNVASGGHTGFRQCFQNKATGGVHYREFKFV